MNDEEEQDLLKILEKERQRPWRKLATSVAALTLHNVMQLAGTKLEFTKDEWRLIEVLALTCVCAGMESIAIWPKRDEIIKGIQEEIKERTGKECEDATRQILKP